MAKYRKKPVVVEAFKWTGRLPGKGYPGWINKAGREGMIWVVPGLVMRVMTQGGVVSALPGDFIVKGIKGELYPVKPEIFEATYEKVEEGS